MIQKHAKTLPLSTIDPRSNLVGQNKHAVLIKAWRTTNSYFNSLAELRRYARMTPAERKKANVILKPGDINEVEARIKEMTSAFSEPVYIDWLKERQGAFANSVEQLLIKKQAKGKLSERDEKDLKLFGRRVSDLRRFLKYMSR